MTFYHDMLLQIKDTSEIRDLIMENSLSFKLLVESKINEER